MLGDLRGVFLTAESALIGGKKIKGTGNGYQELRVWNCSFISSHYPSLYSSLFTLNLLMK